MTCQRCSSGRVVSLNAHCSDLFNCGHYEGYVPTDMGIGGGDDVSFSYCLNCGQIQGNWPLKECKIESPIDKCEECGQSNFENYFRSAMQYCVNCGCVKGD